MRRLAVLFCLLLCGACAGRDFQRPAEGEIVLGKTTQSEVLTRLGNPRGSSTVVKDGVTYTTATYSYAMGANSLVNGVTPARTLAYFFTGGVAVGKEFTSSFDADKTDFDTSKVDSIIKGKTSRAEVIALFGQPGGEYVYPITKQREQRSLVYIYSETKGTAFNLSFRRKRLVVTYGPDDVVSDVEFTQSGPS